MQQFQIKHFIYDFPSKYHEFHFEVIKKLIDPQITGYFMSQIYKFKLLFFQILDRFASLSKQMCFPHIIVKTYNPTNSLLVGHCANANTPLHQINGPRKLRHGDNYFVKQELFTYQVIGLVLYAICLMNWITES